LTSLFLILALGASLPSGLAGYLETADEVSLVSLDGDGQKELGKTSLEPKPRKRLIKALRAAVKKGGDPAMCFNPRHRIVATKSKPKKGEPPSARLTICFECGQVQVQFRSDEVETLGVPTAKKYQKPFDDILKDAAVPLGAR